AGWPCPSRVSGAGAASGRPGAGAARGAPRRWFGYYGARGEAVSATSDRSTCYQGPADSSGPGMPPSIRSTACDPQGTPDPWIVPPNTESRRKRGRGPGRRTGSMAQPLMDLVEQFRVYQRKQRGRTEGGVKIYQWNLEQFLEFVRQREGRLARAGDLTPVMIQAWMEEMASDDLATSTRSSESPKPVADRGMSPFSSSSATRGCDGNPSRRSGFAIWIRVGIPQRPRQGRQDTRHSPPPRRLSVPPRLRGPASSHADQSRHIQCAALLVLVGAAAARQGSSAHHR